MNIGLGVHVHSSDGKDVGTVDKLILDPASGQIKAAVVRKGLFPPKDKESPASLIQSVDDGILYLKAGADEVVI
jgi:sporulation protein YlmC with PRC-barrel domain